ncbi:MAG: nitrate reductase molybdenum cofactor assembly chaperone [Candidatus Zixiibacteriota bacterium]
MTELRTKTYDSLGALLCYPEAGFRERVHECLERLSASKSPALPYIRKFADDVKDKSVIDLEELFTRTFDINPECVLEAGWQLYQENYERGLFIVRMRQLMREFDLSESTELPDHLTHVLQAIGRINDDQVGEFISEYALPAMEKMMKGLKDKENPYENVIAGIQSELISRRIQTAGGVEHG